MATFLMGLSFAVFGNSQPREPADRFDKAWVVLQGGNGLLQVKLKMLSC